MTPFNEEIAVNAELPRAQTQLPRWKCHKEVYAAKILRIEAGGESPGRLVLTFDGGSEAAFVDLEPAWFAKHKPEPGGYYVQYADGYRSYSPAGAFEDGYTRLT